MEGATDSRARQRHWPAILGVPFRVLAEPVVDLVLDYIEYSRVCIDETSEVYGLHDQNGDFVERGHGRGTDVPAKRGAPADQLPGTPFGHAPFPAAVPNGNLGPAAANYHYITRLVAFGH